jgi:hypothetical protein
MATVHTTIVHPRGPSTTTKNEGGTVRNGGNADTSLGPITNVPSLAERTYFTSVYGSNVPAPNYTSRATFPALISGTFAYNPTTPYIIRRVSTTINGTASNVLRFGASDWGIGKSIHKFSSDRRTRLTTWSWTRSSEGPLVYSATRDTWNTPLASDHAATPTRTVPFEFTYRDGGPLPENADGSPRTG